MKNGAYQFLLLMLRFSRADERVRSHGGDSKAPFLIFFVSGINENIIICERGFLGTGP